MRNLKIVGAVLCVLLTTSAFADRMDRGGVRIVKVWTARTFLGNHGLRTIYSAPRERIRDLNTINNLLTKRAGELGVSLVKTKLSGGGLFGGGDRKLEMRFEVKYAGPGPGAYFPGHSERARALDEAHKNNVDELARYASGVLEALDQRGAAPSVLRALLEHR